MSKLNDEQKRAVFRIDQQEGIPKYLLLRNSVVKMISAGRWKAGDKIPAEDALAELTSLSLGTVQRSLRMLVDEGRLVRKHGLGTFVAAEQTPMNAPFLHCRFTDDESGKLLPMFSKMVRRRTIKGKGPWSTDILSDRVICLERLFSINSEFVIYTHLYYDGDRFPELVKLEDDKLNGVNFKDLLSREFHHPLAKFSEKLSIRTFPDYVCKAIKVKPQTAGGVLEIVAYDLQGDAVYFQDLFIPPNDKRLLIAP
jgi:GntR family transcriptional regulator